METLAHILFWLGLASIPLSWVMWFYGPKLEFGRQPLANIADAELRAALREAHAERWGLFVGLWPATLLVLSIALGRGF